MNTSGDVMTGDLTVAGTVSATKFVGDGSGLTNVAGAGGHWKLNGQDAYYDGGNVGVGTSDPHGALHVVGDFLVQGTVHQSIGGLEVDSERSSIRAGFFSLATPKGFYSTVSGGQYNVAHSTYGAIGGGAYNEAHGEAACIPGGYSNRAGGDYSFAAGRRAQALHAGAFVWADNHDADFKSTVDNQFAVRADGGVRFVTSVDGNGNALAEVNLARGGNVGIGVRNPVTKLEVDGAVTVREKTVEPADPVDGSMVLWLSDGTGAGDDGDVLIKITVGATTKTVTLVDFSAQ